MIGHFRILDKFDENQPVNGGSKVKFGAVPLALILLISGMPIGREVTFRESSYAEQLADQTFERAGQIGLVSTWTVALTLGTIYALAAVALIGRRNRNTSAVSLNWFLYALLLSSVLGVAWSPFKLPILMNFVHLVGTALVAMAAGRAYANRPEKLLKNVANALCINVAAHTIAVFLYPDMAISHDGRWSGLTTNPNSLGLLSSLALWATATAVTFKSIRPATGIASALPAMIALYGSGSVTSFVCAVVGIFVLISLLQFKISHFLSVLIAILLVLIVITQLIGSSEYLGYAAILFGKSSDLSGRLPLWEMGIDAALVNPFLGWGYDNHASLMLEMSLPYGHFHNGFIDLVVRGGLLGLALTIVVIASYMRMSIRHSLNLRAAGLSYISMVLIYNLTEVSLLSAKNPSWIIFIVFFFMFHNRSDSGRDNSRTRIFTAP